MGGLPTPAALGEVTQSARQLLIEEAGECLMSDAVVNAGPAVFISASEPNPIMVQPLPFQPGTSFGTTTHPPPPPNVVVTRSASGTSSFGSALRPRNIDIRIRTGSASNFINNSSTANRKENSSY
ncbi:unnamed protein product [Lactuca saligna]|uniref:Uncharacterized protein n=1 Tax=Lactuca saligna TaxID=75948 RepID=A0AA35VBF9_LACSI|nr:unnamed protein product [Lactuca saligna]